MLLARCARELENSVGDDYFPKFPSLAKSPPPITANDVFLHIKATQLHTELLRFYNLLESKKS